MRNIPTSEELKKLIADVYPMCNCKYIEKYIGKENISEILSECAYSFAIKDNKAKFWSNLSDYAFGCITDSNTYFPSNCKEAMEILLDIDCEWKELRQVIEEAGLTTSEDFELANLNPKLLATIFLSSAYALEIDRLVEEAKNRWKESKASRV